MAKVKSIKLPRGGNQQKASHAGNDNELTPAVIISLSDLSEGMQVDEDALLQRLAGILNNSE